MDDIQRKIREPGGDLGELQGAVGASTIKIPWMYYELFNKLIDITY